MLRQAYLSGAIVIPGSVIQHWVRYFSTNRAGCKTIGSRNSTHNEIRIIRGVLIVPEVLIQAHLSVIINPIGVM